MSIHIAIRFLTIDIFFFKISPASLKLKIFCLFSSKKDDFGKQKIKNNQFFALAGLILKKKYQFLKNVWLYVWTLYSYQVPFNYSPKKI